MSDSPVDAEEKLAELILFVADRLMDDAPGGATKLNKVLHYAEAAHVRKYGHPITGVPYQKLAEGPAPRRLVPVRDRLIEAGDAELQEDQYFGYRMDRLVPLRRFNAEILTEDECATVNEVVSAFWGKTARELSDMSHLEAGWRMVEEFEDIPHATAYLPRHIVVTKNMADHAEELAKRRGIA